MDIDPGWLWGRLTRHICIKNWCGFRQQGCITESVVVQVHALHRDPRVNRPGHNGQTRARNRKAPRDDVEQISLVFMVTTSSRMLSFYL